MRALPLIALLTACGAEPAASPSWDEGPVLADDGSGPRRGGVGTLSLWVDPLMRGERTTFTARGAVPGQEVFFLGSVTGAGAGPCRDSLCLDLLSPRLLGTAIADADGVAELTPRVPAGLGASVAFLQAATRGPDALSDPARIEVVDPGEDHAALVAGVSSLDIGGALPSVLVSWRDRAFPVVLDSQDRAMAAAARVHMGKAFVFGHEGALFGATGDFARLVRNAITWMGGPSPTICTDPGLGQAQSWLTGQGLAWQTATPAGLAACDVLFANLHTDRSDTDDRLIREWVAGGGGLMAGGHAWWWGYSNEDAANNHPGNHVLLETGILLTVLTSETGVHAVPATAVAPVHHGSRGLSALLDHLDGTAPLSLADQVDAADAIGDAISVVPLDWPYYDRATELIDAVGPVVPTTADPVRPDSEPLDHVALRLLDRYGRDLPADQVTAHPAAADFPGQVQAGTPRVSRTVSIDADHAGRDERYAYANARADAWRSTGLYAVPGEAITVTVPAQLVGRDVRVRIGAHSDTLWHTTSWSRTPEVSRTWPIDGAVTRVASDLGGLVYIQVPVGAALGVHDVTIDGAVAAPLYIRGVSNPANWPTVRGLDAPWAELVGDRFVLTVPSSTLRTLDDPEALLAFWDDVLDAQAELAAIPYDRPRRERVVTDRQISAGWMHSGYPFMAHDVSAPDFVDLSGLETAGDWGAFHELGHNHQWRDWLLPGTTEATCNLWSVYTMETVVGLGPPAAGHSALSAAQRQARIDAYIAGGRDFWNDWNVWTALETHLQLQEAFGWGFWMDVIGEYNADPLAGAPATDQARIDLFVRRTAQHAGVDLGPFYQAWGFPVSADVLAELALLPPWPDDPMNP